MDLQDGSERRTAVVVGASRGIGSALAREFAVHGWNVAGVSRNPSMEEPRTLAEDFEDRVLQLSGDVTAQTTLEHAAAHVSDHFGPVDVLVNAAGILPTREMPPVTEIDLANLELTWQINALGPVRSVRAFLPILRNEPSKDGSRMPRACIAHITSITGSLSKVEEEREYSYSTSKAALNMIGRIMHRQLAGDGIDVVLIHPGWVRTDMGGESAWYSVEESVAGIYAQITSRRLGDPEFVDFRGRPLPW